MRTSSLKRKGTASSKTSPKKRARILNKCSDLPWRLVPRLLDSAGDGDDGVLELEEVDNVRVVYEETDTGRVAKFEILEDIKQREQSHSPASNSDKSNSGHNKIANILREGSSPAFSEENTELKGLPPTDQAGQSVQVPELVVFDTQSLLPEWSQFSLNGRLSRALYASGFKVPTPIQARAIPAALAGHDVVGVAQTGSGKTLAYGLPILHNLLQQATGRPLPRKRTLAALILTPTRELALQVSSHLNACLSDPKSDTVAPESKSTTKKGKQTKNAKSAAAKNEPRLPPPVSVAAIVGGMSAHKQRRILSRGVDVLVATPGRLWDLIQEDDDLAKQVNQLRYLVLDEADRMVETGHFAELDNILRLTARGSQDNGDVDVPELAEDPSICLNPTKNDNMQTMVFSATMSKELQQNLKKRRKSRLKKSGSNKPESTLDELLERLDMRDSEPEIIDLSPEGGVVETLKEGIIECLSADKDVYLYYFLLRYPGKTLVFLSSIDGIRRLMPLMDLLHVDAFPLHSQLEQRQRLKNLDRFKATQNGVLLATDVAARGLDIPTVDHVIHFQLPRSADTYVHRNGRTARAQRRGFSLLLCGPDERRVVHGLLQSLKRDEYDIPEITVELYMLDKLKARVQLARQIDSARHKVQKENHERKWLRQAADAMEIELDSDLASDDESHSKRQKRGSSAQAAKLRTELEHLLSQPLVTRGVSTRYITSGSVSIADDMVSGNHHGTMIGLNNVSASDNLVDRKRRKPKVIEEEEEWQGIQENDTP